MPLSRAPVASSALSMAFDGRMARSRNHKSVLWIGFTKSDEASWDFLKPKFFAVIVDFYASGKPLFLDSNIASSTDTTIQEFSRHEPGVEHVLVIGGACYIAHMLLFVSLRTHTE
ncbi:putative UDP-arabinose 4-epimerase 2 [Iris pallida]|uniref:UDP-arabinose 4-epimerase 2 n=1 Tax=Iris pallida TaxID=29817 RepID=A0AAX6ER12_IRIPA|nr:putative UDP-arabinose 4-epimerase 2 [Iris pallida]